MRDNVRISALYAPRGTNSGVGPAHLMCILTIMCHSYGSAIACKRGDLHSQHLCAACTTAYTWGYLATEGRARA